MAPKVILDDDSSESSKLASDESHSVTERSGLPPKSPKPVEKAIISDAERSSVSPRKLVSQLIFTEFGLFPVSISPAMAYMRPLLSQCLPISLWKIEAPRPEPETNNNEHHGIPGKCRRCHCKQSRCIKLYCECFAAGAYCDGCSCKGCRNNTENEALRKAAVASILERNPNAFRPKISSTQCSPEENEEYAKMVKHSRGCHCKKTGCLKKYCECFQAKVFCSDNCRCVDCKNSAGCIEKNALSGGDTSYTNTCKNLQGSNGMPAISKRDHCNTVIYNYFKGWENNMTVTTHENNDRKLRMQQANTAISAALRLRRRRFSQELKKRKFWQFYDSTPRVSPSESLKDDKKELRPLDATLLPVVPIGDAGNFAKPGSSKLSGRSLLADIIHSQDAEELCYILLSVAEAAKVLRDQNCVNIIQAVRENQDTGVIQAQYMENSQEGPHIPQEVSDDNLSGNEADKVRKGKPSSPERITPTWIEKDRLPMRATKQGQNLSKDCDADVYKEQEKFVLASFRDYLRKLIALGNMKK